MCCPGFKLTHRPVDITRARDSQLDAGLSCQSTTLDCAASGYPGIGHWRDRPLVISASRYLLLIQLLPSSLFDPWLSIHFFRKTIKCIAYINFSWKNGQL